MIVGIPTIIPINELRLFKLIELNISIRDQLFSLDFDITVLSARNYLPFI